MLTPNEIIEAYIHHSIIARVSPEKSKAFSYNRIASYRHVLQLPWSIQCKGLTVEELDLYCDRMADWYNNLVTVNYDLQQFFKTLDLEPFYNLYKINLK